MTKIVPFVVLVLCAMGCEPGGPEDVQVESTSRAIVYAGGCQSLITADQVSLHLDANWGGKCAILSLNDN